VRSALGSVEGVESVEVDYAAKTATVTAAAGADAKAMIAALEGANFGATVK
jgi:copper chaperone CopZ